MRRRPWLRSGDAIEELVDYALRTVDGPRRFEELERPLQVILTDLASGQPVVVSGGSLRDSLRASCAIPFLFPPVRLGDRFYVDGGVTDNCSLTTAARLNPSQIIAIDLTADAASPVLRRWSDVLDRVMQVALHARVVADFDHFSTRVPVTLICPQAVRRPRFTEFSAMRDAARTAMETLLQSIAGSDGLLAPGVFYLPLTAEQS